MVMGMTDLDTYLRRAETKSARQVAKEAGVTSPYVTDLRYGRRRPSLAVAEAIERATGGEVRVASWGRPSPEAAE
jgi:transcriptional regulator with XRE-family HTH domain